MLSDVYFSGERIFVLKLFVRPDDFTAARKALRDYAYRNAGETITLAGFINSVRKLIPVEDVRFSLAFAPVDWYAPEAWGSYSYPDKTLVKEHLASRDYIIVPFKDDLSVLLPSLYIGFGVALAEASVGGRVLMEKGVPALALIDSMRRPRNLVVFYWDENGRLKAVTASTNVVGVLEDHGFSMAERHVYYGLPVYVLEARENVDTRVLKEFLWRNGIEAYMHRELSNTMYEVV